MLSIFVMYSCDRHEALDRTLACLRLMPGYADCQKTLVCDGVCDQVLPGWENVQVFRPGGEFCWASMWDAGVGTARHEQILYLDCDRLLPSSLLERLAKVRDDEFFYTAQHYHLLQRMPAADCSKILEQLGVAQIPVGRISFEPRHGEPLHGPGKNVMSGCTAFTRKTYRRLGGVDPAYCGHGAFADTDFHMTAAQKGCRFVDIGLPELHYPHEKLDHSGCALTVEQLRFLSLTNFVHYCRKWGLSRSLAEDFAARSGIAQPLRQVRLLWIKDAAR